MRSFVSFGSFGLAAARRHTNKERRYQMEMCFYSRSKKTTGVGESYARTQQKCCVYPTKPLARRLLY